MTRTLAMASCLFLSTSANALTIIDNSPRTPDATTPSGGIAAVGEFVPFEAGIAGFYGESFVTPMTDTYAESLDFSAETYPRSIQQGPTKFRVLLAGCQGGGDCRLNDIVFASPEMSLAQNSGWSDMSVNLDHTRLVGGQEYLWVIDGYTFRNGLTGDASIGTKNNWDGGDMYFGGYLAGSGIDLGSVVLGKFQPGVDLAFSMTFDGTPAVPEIQTWLMLLVGGGFLRWSRR